MKILVIIRSHNDFDHILPYLDYLVKNSIDMVVYLENNHIPNIEMHLRYLKKHLKYNIYILDNEYSNLTRFIVFVKKKIGSYLFYLKRKWYFFPIVAVLTRLSLFLDHFYKNDIYLLLDKHNPTSILLDYGNEVSVYGRHMSTYCRKKGVNLIGYLHGYSIYTNLNTLKKYSTKIGFLKKLIIKISKPKNPSVYCDCYISGVLQKETSFRSSTFRANGFNPSEVYRVKEIGIPRFTREWSSQYKDKILEKKGKFQYGNYNSINVVLFLSDIKFNTIEENLYNMFDELSTIDNINLVFKPHTRKQLSGYNSEKMNAFDATKIPSNILIDWADLAIIYGSSIGIQCLLDDVVLVVPNYIHTNSTIYEQHKVCVSVDSEIELSNLLNKKNLFEIQSLVDKKMVENFIKKIVYNNNCYDKLLESFHDVVTECKVDNGQ
jgi:hypothetical protein